jgi:uncharacterized protein (TIGR03437 family)
MKAQILPRNWLCFVLAFVPLAAEARTSRYILVLSDPPVAKLGAPARIAAAQRDIAAELASRKIRMTGAVNGVLNAVFVTADEGQRAQLAKLPGVIAVADDLPYKRLMVTAVDLHRVSQAWDAAGGAANAGAGVKIAVLDTGIDQQHAAFQDPGLSFPPGYPRCNASDCAYTSAKVIVARSYVSQLELANSPADSRPDDESPRDRVGHGTAVAMVAAGVRHTSPLGAISGVAPKAYLGNYKIFGSPGVNDTTFGSAVISALNDALNDGMDIAVLSFGRPAVWAPLDSGSVCNLAGNQACDPVASAVQNASVRLLVVTGAGNSGDSGTSIPRALNSIESPATAPAALTVGATSNAQRYAVPVRVTGDAPANLQSVQALFGDGPPLSAALRAPLRDSGSLACTPLAAGSLAGTIAMVQRGGAECSFATKVSNAAKAGAVAVLVEQTDGTDLLIPMRGLKETGIPAAIIGSTDGKALRAFLSTRPDRETVIEALPQSYVFEPNLVASFSSLGPSIEGGAIKPEVVATGYPLYMATQKYDPNGDLYSPNGYVAAQGTSFAAPIAAGAAALFKQKNPGATPVQVKSAVVNTASTDVASANVYFVGAGKVDALGAVQTTLSVSPATASFGYLFSTARFPIGGNITLVNHGSAAANVRLQIEGANNAAARVALSDTTFTLAAGASRAVTVRLEGNRPSPGSYSGIITITGGAVPLRFPYSFLVDDGRPVNLIPLDGFDFVGQAGTAINPVFKALDQFGVPVYNATVAWPATQIKGGGRIETAFNATDDLGISEARVILGSQPGEQEFTAVVGGLTVRFTGRAKLPPTISADGVVNAASNQVGSGVAPGSYVAIYGSALSEAFRVASTPYLPLSLANVSVSFDAAGGRSYPGRPYFVSEGQVNVQVPWELQGLSSVQMKVSIGDVSGVLYTVPLNDYSPAVFEIPDPSGATVAAALDENFRLVTTANALQRGRSGQIYCNGLGPVTNTPASGEASPTNPLAESKSQPAVTIGGRPAQVLFSGLTPSSVGLYQINLVPASDTPTGLQSVVITVNGVASKPVNIAIR